VHTTSRSRAGRGHASHGGQSGQDDGRDGQGDAPSPDRQAPAPRATGFDAALTAQIGYRHPLTEDPIRDPVRGKAAQMTSAVKRREQPVAATGRANGRAGRNLPAAIGVGLALGAAIVGSLLLFKPAFLALVAVTAVLGVRELSIAFQERGIRFPLIPVAVGGVGMLVAAYYSGEGALAAALALTIVAVVVWRLTDPAEGYLRDSSAGVLSAVYVPFLAGFAVLMSAADHGAQRVLIFFILTTCNDTGGYATGVLIGRHPMAPSISPKKSWEGLAGSVLTTAAGGAITLVTMLHGQAWQGAVVGAAVVASATLGDLCESMIKRDLGIKDMGTLLPGHGGIMDRLDSLLPTAPVVWLLLALFVPVR
jgi:phosphatidate cytidylyltransferase